MANETVKIEVLDNGQKLGRSQAAPAGSSSFLGKWPIVLRQTFDEEKQRREEAENEVHVTKEELKTAKEQVNQLMTEVQKLKEEKQRSEDQRQQLEKELESKKQEVKKQLQYIEENMKEGQSKEKTLMEQLEELNIKLYLKVYFNLFIQIILDSTNLYCRYH
ncbi:ribonuclease Y-like isoform X2 [Anabas testudineus]|uniref:ribonuclease Y-like isoform X2 n=1 Tax=Anabas testudineus TaxID=64144 RepID=UPI00143DCDFB|nr:ribonuclease Y-like isoform X2 [Anabas testudineus]